MPTTSIQVSLRLNTVSDADIIAWLEKQDNVTATVRRAIRREMEGED